MTLPPDPPGRVVFATAVVVLLGIVVAGGPPTGELSPTEQLTRLTEGPSVDSMQTADRGQGEPSVTAESGGSAATPTPSTARQSSTSIRREQSSTATPLAAHTARDTVRSGANATTVSVTDSGRPGPTVVVIGGQHGNEPAGSIAATEVASWQPDRGVLVVIPRANPRALENGTRKVDGRDLNAQFPAGERPTSPQARAFWGILRRHDADVVIDLHSSDGIYGVDGVGQAVFPTVTGDAVGHATIATDRVNDEFALEGNRSFRRGNAMGRSGKSLTRKVAADMNETAYIVETTKLRTTQQTRVTWTAALAWELLRLHGVVSGPRPQHH